MKYIKSFLILAVAILGTFSISALAQNFDDNNNVSSKTIETKAFKQILKLTNYGVFDKISIKVDGSVVTLSGKVVQPTTKSSAKHVVERITGVSQVINNIEVLPLSNFDNRIRFQALRTLSNGGSLYRYFQGANSSVRIIVDSGNLTLEGFVATRSDYNLMNVLAHGVPGTFRITNNLVVEKETDR